MNQLQTIAESLAESIARQMCATGHTLLFTTLDPDELLSCAMEVFAKTVPEFAAASERTLQEFSDALGVALCNQMLVEHDLILLERRRVRTQ